MSKPASNKPRVPTEVVLMQTGFVTQIQMNECILAFIHEISDVEANDPDDPDNNWRRAEFNCDWLCNVIVVTIKDEASGTVIKKPAKYAYAWFENPQVVNILLGLNPDGTERTQMIQNPKYVKPMASISVGTSLFPTMGDMTAAGGTGYWGDVISPLITVKLPPLASLPSVVYNTEQRAAARADEQTDGLDMHSFELVEPIKADGQRVIERALVPRDPNFGRDGSAKYPFVTANYLRCSKVPKWVQDNPDLIQGYLSRFNTDPSGLYPIISFEVNKNGIIACRAMFSVNGHDASAARLMARKFVLTDRATGQSAELIFDYEPQSFTAAAARTARAAAEPTGHTRVVVPPAPARAWGRGGGSRPSATLAADATNRVRGEFGPALRPPSSPVRAVIGDRPASPPRVARPTSPPRAVRPTSPPRAVRPASPVANSGAGNEPSRGYDDGFEVVQGRRRK